MVVMLLIILFRWLHCPIIFVIKELPYATQHRLFIYLCSMYKRVYCLVFDVLCSHHVFPQSLPLLEIVHTYLWVVFVVTSWNSNAKFFNATVCLPLEPIFLAWCRYLSGEHRSTHLEIAWCWSSGLVNFEVCCRLHIQVQEESVIEERQWLVHSLYFHCYHHRL